MPQRSQLAVEVVMRRAMNIQPNRAVHSKIGHTRKAGYDRGVAQAPHPKAPTQPRGGKRTS